MDLLLTGVDHRTAPADVRDAIAFGRDELPALLTALCADRVVREAVVLSTCNRTEFYLWTPDAGAARAHLAAVLLSLRRVDLDTPGVARVLGGAGAADHLLRVAAGLESMVLGERQILGQVRDAHAAAREAGTLGPALDRLFGAAIHTGRRVHAETRLGTGAVSVASAAVTLSEKICGRLSDRRVLVIGAGETAALGARHFRKTEPARLVIANRTPSRAETLACEVGGDAATLDELPRLMCEADVVFCAARVPAPLVTAAMVRDALGTRPHRPIVILDLAVPRSVAPDVAALENAFVYPVDALHSIVDRGLAERASQVPLAEAIVRAEAGRFTSWVRGLDAAPVVRELREHFERVRAEEVERVLARVHPDERARVERLTQTLVNKLLHLPTVRLRACDSASEAGLGRLEAVRELFGLGAAGAMEGRHAR